MKLLLPLCSVIVVAGAFLIGRSTASGAGSATNRVLVARVGDTIRVPATATRCVVGTKARDPKLSCSHRPKPRYGVVFYVDNLFVYRNGNPDNPVFTAGGHP